MMKHMMALLLVLAASAALHAQRNPSTPSPWAGVWKLVPAKSSPNAPASSTVRIEDVANGIRVTSDSVNKAGATNHTEYTATFDGSEVPVIGGPADATAAATRTGARTFDVVMRSQGATTYGHNEISADGGTRTVTQKLVIGEREASMTLVYERAR